MSHHKTYAASYIFKVFFILVSVCARVCMCVSTHVCVRVNTNTGAVRRWMCCISLVCCCKRLTCSGNGTQVLCIEQYVLLTPESPLPGHTYFLQYYRFLSTYTGLHTICLSSMCHTLNSPHGIYSKLRIS